MTASAPDSRRRAYWLKTLHEWHWISSALSLIGMLLFAITGFTLNHAGQIEAKPRLTQAQATLPAPLVEALQAVRPPAGQEKDATTALPPAVVQWAQQELGARVQGRAVEWSADEAYVPMPRPGGDAWLRLGLEDGEAEFEDTDRGWISYFNDLHKGRHAGTAWSWFIDIFAVACLVFCITGLFILQMHAGRRPLTWPMVGLGLVLPALLALLLVH